MLISPTNLTFYWSKSNKLSNKQNKHYCNVGKTSVNINTIFTIIFNPDFAHHTAHRQSLRPADSRSLWESTFLIEQETGAAREHLKISNKELMTKTNGIILMKKSIICSLPVPWCSLGHCETIVESTKGEKNILAMLKNSCFPAEEKYYYGKSLLQFLRYVFIFIFEKQRKRKTVFILWLTPQMPASIARADQSQRAKVDSQKLYPGLLPWVVGPKYLSYY